MVSADEIEQALKTRLDAKHVVSTLLFLSQIEACYEKQ